MASGSTTFPLLQSGSFTPVAGTSNIKYTRVRYLRRNFVSDVTGSNESGTQDTHKVFVHGIPIREIIGIGTINPSGTSFGLAQNCTLTIGTIKIQAQQWTLRKSWPLKSVTNSSEAEWSWGIPTVSISATGHATGASGPVSSTESDTVTTAIDLFGSLTGTCKIDEFVINGDLSDGGPVPCSFSGRYSSLVGSTAYTPTATNFSWLFPEVPDDPVKGNLTLDTNGESITHSALCYSVSFSNPAHVGGSIIVETRNRFDKA